MDINNDFIVTDNQKIIFSTDIKSILNENFGMSVSGGENVFLKKDVENTICYFKKNYPGKSGDTIEIELTKLLNNTGFIDGEANQAIFWLAVMLMNKGAIRSISYPNVMKLMPFIASNVKARELKNERMKKDTEQLKIFMEIYQNAQLKMSNDCTITADEVLEKIITALPDINIIRREAEKRPQILDILKNIHNLSSVCADIELKNKVDTYMELLNIQS
jgi:hypothetical protein